MKKVAVFELTDPIDKSKYEDLLNDPTVEIIEKQFSYTGREGTPKVTIWYIQEM
jgi:hypothetical protein